MTVKRDLTTGKMIDENPPVQGNGNGDKTYCLIISAKTLAALQSVGKAYGFTLTGNGVKKARHSWETLPTQVAEIADMLLIEAISTEHERLTAPALVSVVATEPAKKEKVAAKTAA